MAHPPGFSVLFLAHVQKRGRQCRPCLRIQAFPSLSAAIPEKLLFCRTLYQFLERRCRRELRNLGKISSPVRGLCACLSLRSACSKIPNPWMVTLSPAATLSMITSVAALSTFSVSVLLNPVFPQCYSPDLSLS